MLSSCGFRPTRNREGRAWLVTPRRGTRESTRRAHPGGGSRSAATRAAHAAHASVRQAPTHDACGVSKLSSRCEKSGFAGGTRVLKPHRRARPRCSSARCQRRSVCGLNAKHDHRSGGSSRLTAASDARSAAVYCGRLSPALKIVTWSLLLGAQAAVSPGRFGCGPKPPLSVARAPWIGRLSAQSSCGLPSVRERTWGLKAGPDLGYPAFRSFGDTSCSLSNVV